MRSDSNWIETRSWCHHEDLDLFHMYMNKVWTLHMIHVRSLGILMCIMLCGWELIKVGILEWCNVLWGCCRLDYEQHTWAWENFIMFWGGFKIGSLELCVQFLDCYKPIPLPSVSCNVWMWARDLPFERVSFGQGCTQPTLKNH